MSIADAMEPRLLRSFVMLAEELHFGRAAARLHIAQPPLSMQIRQLEQRVGAQLFERDRRHVALTEAGAFLVDRARHILAEAERSCLEAARIARGESGVLSVGYTPTATYEVLPSILRAFRPKLPAIRLELVELRSALQPDALRSGRIEVGLACGPIDQPDLVEHVLAREHFIVAVPSRHRLAARKSVRLRELCRESIVAVRPDIEPAWANACAAALARARVGLDLAQETDSKIAMLGLVAAGVGLAIVSQSMRRLARQGVVYRPISDLKVEVPLVALTAITPSPRARALISAFSGSSSPGHT